MKAPQRILVPAVLSQHAEKALVVRKLVMLILACALLAFSSEASFGYSTMPAGSRVWMDFDSNVCPGGANFGQCAASNLYGPNGLPLQTFTSGSSYATGFAEVTSSSIRSFASANPDVNLYVSMNDTYTVHGSAAGLFPVTVHLDTSGYFLSVPFGTSNLIGIANVQAEIGTFSPDSTSVPFLEQFRITPFNPSTVGTVAHSPTFQFSSTPSSTPFILNVTYTKNVSVGDVFDIGYGITSGLTYGGIDLTNTGLISFDLPSGVFLTSALGGTFGTTSAVPEPATMLLLGLGLIGLAGVRRKFSN